MDMKLAGGQLFSDQIQSKLRKLPIIALNRLWLPSIRQSFWRKMPRPKLHRVACDCLDCEQDMSKPALSAESSAAARQDPPPKCLLIHAEPAWPSDRDRTADASTSEAAATPYLHRLAQQGCCGLVSYQETPQGVCHCLLWNLCSLFVLTAYMCYNRKYNEWSGTSLAPGVTGSPQTASVRNCGCTFQRQAFAAGSTL